METTDKVYVDYLAGKLQEALDMIYKMQNQASKTTKEE